MVELGIPELTTEQIENLCQGAESAARKAILSKVSNKEIDRLDISVEAEGAKPVSLTVEINLVLLPQVRDADVQAIVTQATAQAHEAAENFLRTLK